MLSNPSVLKKLSVASFLLAALGVACSPNREASPSEAEASSVAQASSAVHPTCALPYIPVCDASGTACRCEIDPTAAYALPAKDIAAASASTYIIKTDGTVWGWGASNGSYGSPLGPIVPGSVNGDPFPDPVTQPMALGISNAVQLAASSYGACALIADGTVSCVGTLVALNGSQVPTPVRIAGAGTLTNVASISRGDSHVCALLNDNSVKCWGDNRFGQLGDGSTTSSDDAVAMKVWPATQALTATQVVAAGNTTCVRYSNGQVFCVGENTRGQLGLGSHGDYLPTTQPQPVQSVSNVDLLFGGGLGTFCVHQSDGQTLCWGDDENNQLDGVEIAHDAFSPHTSPIATTGQATRAFSIYNGCAWATDGTPTCWGSSLYGLLGAGTSVMPRGMGGLGPVVQMAIGDDHVCAIDRVQVMCWGYNNLGQLGVGHTNAVSGTIPVSTLFDTTSECSYGSRRISCSTSGNGLNGDSCHCPACVPRSEDQVCAGVACGIRSLGCGKVANCGRCPGSCPPGMHNCGDDGCMKGNCY